MSMIFLMFFFLRGCNGVIYSLNSSEYNRMPPLYGLDDFEACLLEPGGTYCLVDADLFSERPSDLMHLIQEYSADVKKHYNHTQIHRGVCVTKSCQHLNYTWDLNETLEVCLNESIWKEYNIQAKLSHIHYCKRDVDHAVLDVSDFVVIIVYMVLIALNIIGSLYDVLFCHQNSKSGNPYVLSFSLRRNWEKLVAPSGVGTDHRLQRLKSFHGLRLTPTYALILATISTLMRHIGSGPMWDLVVTSESNACRQYWWAHVFYIQNYIYDDKLCVPVSWYLAADTQLFCLGLLICMTCRTMRTKKVALLTLFLLSLLITSSVTYFLDLDAIIIQSPETCRNLYVSDYTFNYMYIPGHTNLSTYIMGLSGGFLAYHWQEEGKNLDKYKIYQWVIWLLFPIAVLEILSGAIFYLSEDDMIPTAFKVLYATLYKPLFQLLIVTFIISCVFKLESCYRKIVEWRGFTWAGRLSYGTYLVHTLVIKGLIGSQTHPTHMTDYYVLVVLAGSVMLSFLAAGALWLCVEAPVAGLVRAARTRTGGQRVEGH
ncbi:unnamed protein product [Parnassius apollo]|uniref:(apollo) hypothetical protein n=1 Tax=Parnassius apollo TaxID=110799 RepID=A0A8S3XDQ5_PARAO|nr:unnamed protein product [Parnassius apollo]